MRDSVQHGAQDYRCPTCGHEECDIRAEWVLVPEHARQYKGEEQKSFVVCTRCMVTMDWIPRRAQHDLLTGGEGRSVEIDGTVHTFSSAHEMRRFESESQKRAASGEGQAYSFRALSQNRGNMDRNSLKGSAFVKNEQIPHEQLGKTERGRKIGRGVLSPEQAERVVHER